MRFSSKEWRYKPENLHLSERDDLFARLCSLTEFLGAKVSVEMIFDKDDTLFIREGSIMHQFAPNTISGIQELLYWLKN